VYFVQKSKGKRKDASNENGIRERMPLNGLRALVYLHKRVQILSRAQTIHSKHLCNIKIKRKLVATYVLRAIPEKEAISLVINTQLLLLGFRFFIKS
jgi:hypothetical protein